MTTTTPRSKPGSSQEVLSRYPRLTAHLVCESLGYLTPWPPPTPFSAISKSNRSPASGISKWPKAAAPSSR